MKSMIYTALAVCAMLTACGGGAKKTADRHEESAAEKTSAGEIVFSPEQAEAAGVKTETAKTADFRGAIRTSGRILPSAGGEATVSATSAGIVSFGKRVPAEGASVGAGEVIATVSARNMADGDPVAKARINYEQAEKEYRRAETLVGDRIISQREYDKIKSDYLTAKAAYEGVSGGSKDDGAAVVSPLKGFVKQVLAKQGAFVNVGDPIAVVAADALLQLRADLPEKYAAQRTSISAANFRLPYRSTLYSTEQLGGRLVAVGKSADEGSPYLPVTFEFKNTGDITSGTYADVWLLTGASGNVISVPESALTEEQGLYFVYVRLDEDCYRKQHVTLGRDNGRRVEILSGLEAGDEVVTEGAYHIKLASVSTVVPEGHTHNH